MSANTEEQLLRGAIARLRASVMSLVFAVVGGTGLFVARAWLLIRAGDDVGRHLSLLDNYFPGYSVSWVGCGVGFFYGALTGGALGWSIAFLRNVLVSTYLHCVKLKTHLRTLQDFLDHS